MGVDGDRLPGQAQYFSFGLGPPWMVDIAGLRHAQGQLDGPNYFLLHRCRMLANVGGQNQAGHHAQRQDSRVGGRPGNTSGRRRTANLKPGVGRSE